MAEIYTPFVRRSIDIKHQGNKEWSLTLRCDLAVPLALSASMRPISGAPWYFAGGCAGKGGASSPEHAHSLNAITIGTLVISSWG